MPRHDALAEQLNARRRELAVRVAEVHLQRRPDFLARFGPAGRDRCIEDAEFHLRYLAQALQFGAPELFVAYTRWARELLERRKIPWSDLQQNLEVLRDEVAADLGDIEGGKVRDMINRALEASPESTDSYLSPTRQQALARAYLTALLRADRRTATDLIQSAVRQGMEIRDLYLDVFQPVQREIGRLWQTNEITVAEEHYCTASTQALMAQFYPQILSTPRVGKKVVVACVGNELHEIGTRMVADFFEMAGWDSIYLGANTPAAALIDLVARERPDLVALGVTMTYHLETATDLLRKLRSDPRSKAVKVIVGGYVFQINGELWRQMGADGVAGDAAEAVAIGEKLVRAEK